jgi:hypothetical protein
MDCSSRHSQRMQRLAATVVADPEAFIETCRSLTSAAASTSRSHLSHNSFALFCLKEAPQLCSLIHTLLTETERGAGAPLTDAASSSLDRQAVLKQCMMEERLLWHGLHTLYVAMTTLEEREEGNQGDDDGTVSALLGATTSPSGPMPMLDAAARDSILHTTTTVSVFHSITSAAGAVVSELSVAMQGALQWSAAEASPEVTEVSSPSPREPTAQQHECRHSSSSRSPRAASSSQCIGHHNDTVDRRQCRVLSMESFGGLGSVDSEEDLNSNLDGMSASRSLSRSLSTSSSLSRLCDAGSCGGVNRCRRLLVTMPREAEKMSLYRPSMHRSFLAVDSLDAGVNESFASYF